MKKLCVLVGLLITLSYCNFKKENRKDTQLQKDNIELFKNDLKSFTHLLGKKRVWNDDVFIFPFCCMSKYLPNSDVNSVYSQIDEATFLKLKDELLTDRDIAQFSKLTLHIDSIDAPISKLSSSYPPFISIAFTQIKYKDKLIPDVTCNEVAINSKENMELLPLLIANADKQSIIIETTFAYSLEGKEGSKRFIFVKKEGKYKLAGIRAYGHVG